MGSHTIVFLFDWSSREEVIAVNSLKVITIKSRKSVRENLSAIKF